MRNLRLTRRNIFQSPEFSLPLGAATWDPSTSRIICAFGPSEIEPSVELKRLDFDRGDHFEAERIEGWDLQEINPNLSRDQILSLHYFADTTSACLVFEGGDIIVVREQPLPGEHTIENIGSIEEGISAAAWSPDEELLAIATKADTLIYMTRDFEPNINIKLSPEDVKVSSHVSVGWGKKETQFQGKRAKALRDPTVPEHVDEGVLSSLDDGKITITWRGDGGYLALNAIENSKRRMIRVFSREGVLDSVSEPVDGLEGALSWRPAGNLIAGIQRRSDRIDVVFFERNGLRHGEFNLRLTSEDMETWAKSVRVDWNCDSTILAVSFLDRVQFWTMGNYHYYLKQEVKSRSKVSLARPIQVCWHAEKPQMVAILDQGKQRLLFTLTQPLSCVQIPYKIWSLSPSSIRAQTFHLTIKVPLLLWMEVSSY
jgi:elongator complex protein 1